LSHAQFPGKMLVPLHLSMCSMLFLWRVFGEDRAKQAIADPAKRDRKGDY